MQACEHSLRYWPRGFLAGCASKAADVAPAYVSPVAYQGYRCQQLTQEARQVSAHAARAAGVQNKKARNDAIATGTALVLFWPAAFFVSGDGASTAELANLRGQKKPSNRPRREELRVLVPELKAWPSTAGGLAGSNVLAGPSAGPTLISV